MMKFLVLSTIVFHMIQIFISFSNCYLLLISLGIASQKFGYEVKEYQSYIAGQ